MSVAITVHVFVSFRTPSRLHGQRRCQTRARTLDHRTGGDYASLLGSWGCSRRMNTSAAGTEQSGRGQRSGLEYGLPLQVSNIFTLAGDGIREQGVSCDAAEGDTTELTGMSDQSMELEETLGMGWLMKHHKGCSKHTRACIRLDICSTYHFQLLKNLEAHTFLSIDVS